MKKIFLILGFLFACFTAQAASTIHILFVYTPAAATSLGGGSTINDKVNRMISEMNQAFANSGIGSSVAVVSAGVFSTSTAYPMNTRDAVLSSIAAAENNFAIALERDITGADVVAVLGPPAFSGSGIVICGYSDGFLPGPKRAFAMVAADCFMTEMTLQHEVGHLMGLHHDYASDPSCTPGYPNCHGYRFEFNDGTSADYCANTIMAVMVNTSCDETGPNQRINYYGNPSVKISNGMASVPTGNTASPYYADEAHTLLFTVPIVANYHNTKISKVGSILYSVFGQLFANQ